MTGPGDGFKITPSDLDSSGSKLASFGDKMDATSSKLTSTHAKLTSSAGKDKSGVGSVIAKFAAKSEEVMGKIGKEAGRVIKGASQRLKKNGAAHAENEATQTKAFKGIHEEPKSTKAHTGENTAPQSTKTSSGADFKDPKTPHSGGDGQSTQPSSSGSGKGGGSGEPPQAPKGGPNEGSGAPGGSGDPHGGGGGGDGDKGPSAPKGDEDPAAKASPPLSGKKPPTAGSEYSDEFKNKPTLPQSSAPSKPLPDSNSASYHMPPDKSRGAKVEQIDESRVTRGDDGLIKTVDGKPVKDYIGDKSSDLAKKAGNPQGTWKAENPDAKKPPKNMPGKEGTCSAVAVDLKTGLVTQGVNGKATNTIPEENLHPLLQQNLQDLRAYKHPVTGNADGTPAMGRDGTTPTPPHDGRAHYSIPAQHAEVKATNELLWARQSQLKPGETLPPSTLNEMRFDPRWTGKVGDAGAGDAAPACANCNTILGGVPSYTGRCQYDPGDYRYANPNIPAHEDQ